MKKNILIVIIFLLVMTGIVIFIESIKTEESLGEEEISLNEDDLSVETGLDLEPSIDLNDELNNDFIQCLADSGMVIYGSRTCPACTQLAESFGGYDKIALIYVECSEERERCSSEMQTNYVPEIQIQGNLYEGSRDLGYLAKITDCEL